MVRVLVIATVLAGCYRSGDPRSCTVTCDRLAENPGCPSGLTCNADNLCAESATASCPDTQSDATTGDGDGSTGLFCHGTGPVQVCFAIEPSQPVPLAQTTYDTMTCSLGQVRDDVVPGLSVCVIAGSTVDVSRVIEVTGINPLVIVGVTEVRVEQLLDVSSARAPNRIGAGANFVGCASIANATPPGGGVGGSFRSRGGFGGSNTQLPGAVLANEFHGGCRGSRGGDNPGAGGSGGGAVFLISDVKIQVDGSILANGAGGAGGLNVASSGGAGGGSGGYIGLDAPVIALAGTTSLRAVGGGGGAGGDNGFLGEAGHEQAFNQTTAALGGGSCSGSTDCGFGGDGGVVGDGGDGTPETAGGGAGGGGGGHGAIQFYGSTPSCPNCQPVPTN